MNKNHIVLELHKVLELLSAKCKSEMSKKLAASTKPSTDYDTVVSEINKTNTAFDLSVKFGSPKFHRLNDITDIVKLADSGSMLSLVELLWIKDVLIQAEELIDYRAQYDGETNLDYLFDSVFPNAGLKRNIQKCIVNEEEIADDASQELSRIRRKIAQTGVKIRDTLEKMTKSSSTQKYLQESLVTIRDGRFVLPVKAEHKGSVDGLVHAVSATGSTVFIEPIAVVEANNEIQMLLGEEKEEINRIISELSLECANFKEQLLSNIRTIPLLEVYFAKAGLAADMNASRPEIVDSGLIKLKKARHPLIDKSKVVPVDFSIEGENSAVIITGPNTGGKTVLLKTVGLLSLMTMCGMFIPASDGSVISVFGSILVDIGDSQSIENNLSTFSSHMNSVIDIINRSDSNSLVLLDELGSGTDPVEGAALAVSIIEKMKNNGAKIVATTHYQELKVFALETDGVINASCEFDSVTLKPTYKIILGSPGKSNAFEIAKNLGMPEDIINSSKNLISDDDKKLENALEELETTRREYERLLEAIKEESKEVSRLKDELSNARESLNDEYEKKLKKIKEDQADFINSFQKKSFAILDELDEIRKEKNKKDFSQRSIDIKHRVISEIESLNKSVVQREHGAEKPSRPLKKGDSVIVIDTGKPGTLVSDPDSSGLCFVQVGIMKTKINVSRLKLVENSKITVNNKKLQPRVTKSGVESNATRRPQLELDIRGYASDDGIYELDMFIDNAVMSGISLITVIHGKGTGVLKDAVRRHLKSHKQVKSFRRGVYGEGEDGVTIVELK